MAYDIGDLVIAKVEKVRPYALFLACPDGAKGLLHISEISDDYVRDIEKFGSVGDELKLMVIEIDAYNGFLRFSYKKVPEEERYSTHVENEKRIPVFNEADFSSLESKLPEWIDETLKKAGKK